LSITTLPGKDMVERMRLQMKREWDSMKSAYESTKQFLQEFPNWTPIIVACVQLADESGDFASSAVNNRAQLRGFILVPLRESGILERTGDSIHRGHNAIYRMPDREGVKRALIEMGIDTSKRLPGDWFNLAHRT
jgi:hypothetical protein